MKKAIIFLNGDPPTPSEYESMDLAKPSVIICADGAYRYLKGVITPDIVMGDFDSMDMGEITCECEVVRFPVEKDFTDGHIVVEKAIELGARDITVYGAFGGRPDHEYSNLSLLYLAKQKGASARLVGSGFTVTLESGRIEKRAKTGVTVSIVPFLASAHILQTEGLKYPMRNVTLDRMHILGISNVATAETITLTADGEVLVFIQNE